MGFHMTLESKSRAAPNDRRLSTYAHGFRVLKAITRRNLIDDIQLKEIHFRALATLGGEMFINNKGDWLGLELHSELEEILEKIESIIKDRDIKFPYFTPDTLETTVLWKGVIDKKSCSGYIHFREPRAEGAYDFGHIEIDLFEIDNSDDVVLAQYLIERVKSGHMEMSVLEDLASFAIHAPDAPQVFRYRKPSQVVLSISEKPIPLFYEAYVFGVISGKSFPRFFRETLSDIPRLWEAIAEKKQYKEYSPPVDHLKQVFETIKPSLLDNVLGKQTVYHQLLENSQKAEVSLTTSSLIVSSENALWGFLEAMIKTYDMVLTPVYEIIVQLRSELGVRVIRI